MSSLEIEVDGPNVKLTLHAEGRPHPIVMTMDVGAAVEAGMALTAAIGVIAKTSQDELQKWVQTG